MQWVKHMTDMVDDPKIRRLIRKHGALGYAVYNLAIERIGKRLSTDSPLPDLEETAEDIADMLQADTVKVEQVMTACLAEGLFEVHEVTGKVLCAKIYKFIEKSQTRSLEVRAMIDAYRNVSDKLLLSETVSDSPRQIETVSNNPDRREEKRREERRDMSSLKPNIDSTSLVVKKPKAKKEPDERVTAIIAYLNEKAGTRYHASAQATQRHIHARLREGHDVDDFKRAVIWCLAEWQDDPKMEPYLRPDTIFGTKMPGYVENYARKKRRLEEEA